MHELCDIKEKDKNDHSLSDAKFFNKNKRALIKQEAASEWRKLKMNLTGADMDIPDTRLAGRSRPAFYCHWWADLFWAFVSGFGHGSYWKKPADYCDARCARIFVGAEKMPN